MTILSEMTVHLAVAGDVYFVLSFFPRDVLDEILDYTESVLPSLVETGRYVGTSVERLACWATPTSVNTIPLIVKRSVTFKESDPRLFHGFRN